MAWIVDLASMLRLSLVVYMVACAALLSVLRRMQAVELAKRAVMAS